MASGQWADSDRGARLPPDWPQRRDFTRKRAGNQCEWYSTFGKRCESPGSECDHRDRGDDHSLNNLQWLCTYHHAKKSAREGVEARAALRAQRVRTPEAHPGIVEE